MSNANSLLALILFAGAAAGQPTVQTSISPALARSAAPSFALKDAAGKTVTLAKYRGKVVLLDFWATWCHGCKEEIPWFSEFHKTYAREGLAVVGVSLDDDGWKTLRPFLAQTKPPYRIILGNDSVAKSYGIESMPDTFLIDRHGRIAAVYRAGLVDRANIEANIKELLAQ